MTDLFRLLPAEMEALVAEFGQPRFRANQILDAIYRRGATSIEELRDLPARLREQLVEAGHTVGSTSEVNRVEAPDGMTTKLLLQMQRETLIETVLMRYPAPGRHPRATVCVSTQAGCAMGCVFCATGQMGFERNLRAEEVVAQVVAIRRVLAGQGEHVTNVVFMGMGEPLANYAETVRAVRLLTEARCFGLAQRAITVSTVGLVHAIDRLANEGLQVGLAISLHAPNDELRRRLVPTAGPTSVRDLVAAAGRYFTTTGRRVSFEYALIDGINDSPPIASELATLLRGKPTHINLIPVNATSGGYRKPAPERVRTFQNILVERGINVTVRAEKGAGISAACGQLRTDFQRFGDAEDQVSVLPSAAVHGRRQTQSARELSPLPAQTPT